MKSLCGEGFDAGRLFFVGDFKQSIYRFRGAAAAGVSRACASEVPEAGRLPLTLNFRSQPAILHFVNALFCDAFAEYERLRAAPRRGRPATAGRRIPVDDHARQEQQRKGRAGKRPAARKPARSPAGFASLIDPDSDETPIVDKETGEPRRVKPGDVAILFRALSDVQLYEEALREYGLDYYLVGGHAFYAQQEIYDVLNLLRAVASTADEVSLAGVLRSPFFALADETLFWLVDRPAASTPACWPRRCRRNFRPKNARKVGRRRRHARASPRDEGSRADRHAARRGARPHRLRRRAAGRIPRRTQAGQLHKLIEQARAADAAASSTSTASSRSSPSSSPSRRRSRSPPRCPKRPT